MVDSDGFFGPPYWSKKPSRRKIDAQLGFYADALREENAMGKRNVIVTPQMRDYLQMIVNADIKMREDARVHAHSHGDVGYLDPNLDIAHQFIVNLRTGIPLE